MSYLEAIILAIIEGLTEFLPVSSTGHMIIASALMGLETSAFVKLFTIVIQLGTILSVLVLYWKRFFRSMDFYYKLVVAAIPASILGLALNDVSGLDRFLAFSELPGVKLAEWGLVILLSIHLCFGLRLLIIEFVSWPTPQSLRLNLVGWGVALSVVIGLFFLLGVFGQ